MDCITTYTKKRFAPKEAVREDISIVDIAHALSMMCRANGHFPQFFSVGQHSVNCAREAAFRGYSHRVQLACLLHDASEAYLSDITRPVKKELPAYYAMEEKLQNLIYETYISPSPSEAEMKQVGEVDNAMLYCEFLHFMGERIFDNPPVSAGKPDFEAEVFVHTESRFLALFRCLAPILKMEEKGTPHLVPPQLVFPLERKAACVGVDGCKGGWMSACIHGESDTVEIRRFERIEDLCNYYSYADCFMIDIPLGLPESAAEMENRPDFELRKRLGRKGSSVFNTAFRQVVRAETTEKAWDESRRLSCRMSVMGMAIRGAICQVDVFLEKNPLWKERFLESHPEYCFAVLNGGQPLLEKKTTEEGWQARIQVLKGFLPAVDKAFEDALADKQMKRVMDDFIDALCLAVAGRVAMENGFLTIPEKPRRDALGIPMQILYPKI